jgi:hypothetical protein
MGNGEWGIGKSRIIFVPSSFFLLPTDIGLTSD